MAKENGIYEFQLVWLVVTHFWWWLLVIVVVWCGVDCRDMWCGVVSCAVCCVVWWCGVLDVRKDAGQDERVLVWACWSLTAHSLSTRQTLLVTTDKCLGLTE